MKPYLWLIRVIGVIVPRRVRADWRRWPAGFQRVEPSALIRWWRYDMINSIAD